MSRKVGDKWSILKRHNHEAINTRQIYQAVFFTGFIEI